MKKILIGLVLCVYFCSCNSIESKVETTIYGESIINQDNFTDSDTTLSVFDSTSYNQTVEKKTFSEDAKLYFEKVAKKNEFENDSKEVSKWKRDIKIYVKGDQRDYLISELNKIVSELNELISEININVVQNESDANFIVFLGSEKDYNNYEVSSIGITEHNFGLFVVYGGNEYTNGNMYVDLYRIESKNAQRHILREELTQSLGLTNDTYDYPESIFYQGWTETTEYAPIDRELIQMLYN